MQQYLPQTDGYLPLYVLLVGVTAITNAISCYNTDSYVKRLYAAHEPDAEPVVHGITRTTSITSESIDPPPDRRPSVTSIATADVPQSPITPLASRLFATWNIAVGVVRLFAAYHIREPAWYQMQMITNIVGLVHFSLEAFVFNTAKPSGPWLAPVSVASIGLVWSVAQYGHYVKQ